VDAFIPEQLEAPDVHTGNDCNLFTGIDRDEKRCREVQSEVDLAACDCFRLAEARIGHYVANVGKAFCPQ
jgi:hypothetical protein